MNSQHDEFNYTSKEFIHCWTLISNISLQKESMNSYLQFVSSIAEKKEEFSDVLE